LGKLRGKRGSLLEREGDSFGKDHGEGGEGGRSFKCLWRGRKGRLLLRVPRKTQRDKLTSASSSQLVVTELGYLPPSSVPVVIREYRKEVTL
jgi:hypothetical protein